MRIIFYYNVPLRMTRSSLRSGTIIFASLPKPSLYHTSLAPIYQDSPMDLGQDAHLLSFQIKDVADLAPGLDQVFLSELDLSPLFL